MSNHRCPSCLSNDLQSRGYRNERQRYQCNDCGRWTSFSTDKINKSLAPIDPILSRKNKNKVKGGRRFIITTAQNATPVHTSFMDNLHALAEDKDAQLLVAPIRYKNPTSLFSDSDQDWWATAVKEYLVDARVELCKGLILLGDMRTQPTAINPLSGLEGFTSTESIIVPHPKIAMSSVPTHSGEMAKLIMSTGACTVENYTVSKAGKKGEHHHTLGAVIVEVDEAGYFHLRHINAAWDGSFYDLTRYYSGGVARDNPSGVRALVLGDLHHPFVDPLVERAVWDEIIPELTPDHVIIHDPVDCFSVNRFDDDNPFAKFGKYKYGMSSIEKELTDFTDWMQDKMEYDSVSNYVIVSSNHSDWVQNYLKRTDWRDDPENAEFYLKTALHLIQNTKADDDGIHVPDAFKYWIEKLLPTVRVLSSDESFRVGDIELGMHGHLGPNGARGSLASLSKVGCKSIIGHVHSCGIKDGTMAVGVTCRLRPKYARGPSSWMQSHAVIYPNYKRTLIHTIDGRWRG